MKTTPRTGRSNQMLNVTFKGTPYLFVGRDLNQGGPLTPPEDFKAGRVSFAHYYPVPDGGIVKRYNDVIGTGADLVVVGPADPPAMDTVDVLLALDNMLGGDPGWFGRPGDPEDGNR